MRITFKAKNSIGLELIEHKRCKFEKFRRQ